MKHNYVQFFGALFIFSIGILIISSLAKPVDTQVSVGNVPTKKKK